MEIIGIVLAIVLIVGMLFYGFAFPVWMIVDAGISERSTTSKVIWILVVILTWTLGAAIYGIFAAKGVAKKIISLFGGLAALGFLGMLVASMSMLGPIIEGAPKEIAASIRAASHQDISDEELKVLESHVFTLVEETPFSLQALYTDPSKLQVNMALLEKIGDALEDGEFTRSEFDAWMRLFESRSVLDPDKLED